MNILNDIARWQRNTFGHELCPEDAVARLEKELAEFLKNSTPEEAADCVICAIDLFRSIPEFNPDGHILFKHAVNQARKWNVAPDGTGQHLD